MTFYIATESHGDVEAGFFSAFTDFSRFGDHAFPTKHFCELAKYLAENPSFRRGKFLVYSEDRFWEKNSEFVQGALEQWTEAKDSWLPDLDGWQNTGEQGHVGLEDDVDLLNERYTVTIEISPDGKHIQFAEYRIGSIHFARFAWYLARGGILGWTEGREPAYADETMQAIRTSKNPLFAELQREIDD